MRIRRSRPAIFSEGKKLGRKFNIVATLLISFIMSKESIVFTLGILLLIIPNLGIPDSWKFYFLIVAGVLLIVTGYSLRRASFVRSIEKENGERSTDSFVEHNGTRVIRE